MFPYRHTTDAQFLAYLLIFHSSEKSHFENTLLSWRKMCFGEIYHPLQPLFIIFWRLCQLLLTHIMLRYALTDGLLGNAFKARIPDTRQQIVLRCIRQQSDIGDEQPSENIAADILTFLFIIQYAHSHPVPPIIILPEQCLYILIIHHHLLYNTHKKCKC